MTDQAQMRGRFDQAMDRADWDLSPLIRVYLWLGGLRWSARWPWSQCHRRGLRPRAVIQPWPEVGATSRDMAPQVMDHPLEPHGRRSCGRHRRITASFDGS